MVRATHRARCYNAVMDTDMSNIRRATTSDLIARADEYEAQAAEHRRNREYRAAKNATADANMLRRTIRQRERARFRLR